MSRAVMLHHHACVLLDDDVTVGSRDVTADSRDVTADRVRLLVVGGGGNCFSFGTHFNRHLMMLTVDSNTPTDNSHSAAAPLS